MSWFTSYVEHPAMNWLANLAKNPVIADNPAAAAAVADAQKQAGAIASTTTSAAAGVQAAVLASANPLVKDAEDGLQAVVDGFLLSGLGNPALAPLTGLTVPAVNAFLTLGESKMHDIIASLFSHAKSQIPPAKAA